MALSHKGFKRCSLHAGCAAPGAFIYYIQRWTWTWWHFKWIACCKALVGVHMAGVCGHTWGNKPVLEPAPGHRNHPSPPLWLPHLQRQQPVQHELARHGSSREAWGWAGLPPLLFVFMNPLVVKTFPTLTLGPLLSRSSSKLCRNSDWRAEAEHPGCASSSRGAGRTALCVYTRIPLPATTSVLWGRQQVTKNKLLNLVYASLSRRRRSRSLMTTSKKSQLKRRVDMPWCEHQGLRLVTSERNFGFSCFFQATAKKVYSEEEYKLRMLNDSIGS